MPTGDCFLDPEFRGLQTASSDGAATCSASLTWDAAVPFCGSEVRYNIYRDTTPGFTPGPSNRIASCVAGTGYTDTDGLGSGTDYHYVVRAEDQTSGHGGPCSGGNEETNSVELSVRPDGPPEYGSWSDDAGDSGVAAMQLGPSWSIDSADAASAPNSYRGDSSAILCTDLVTPVLSLDAPGQGPGLSFSTRHELDYDPAEIFAFMGSLGQVEIAVGPDFDNWTRVALSPDYPAFVDLELNECPSTSAIFINYFSGWEYVYNTYTASLVSWGGQDIRLRFHLSGDLYFPNGSWWVDDIVLTEVLVPGSCETAAGGPPPLPDGATVPGQPLAVAKSGSDLLLTWDSAACSAAAVNVYRGAIGDYSTFTAGDCDLPANGSATLSIPDDSWFLVVATDGGSTDGSWSRDASGAELTYAGASTACPAITAHNPFGSCP